jgi:hypothetical protein
MGSGNGRLNVSKGGATIVVPVFILMVGLGIINWLLPGTEPEAADNEVTQAASSPLMAEQLPAALTQPVAQATLPLAGLATPWAVAGQEGVLPATLSATTPLPSLATPALSPAATIQLLGPPEESNFLLDSSISFYWNWPLSLETNQRFTVYLRMGGEEWPLGVVEQRNMGASFRLHVNPSELVSEPAAYEWVVKLEQSSGTDTGTNQVLVESEARPLSLQ